MTSSSDQNLLFGIIALQMDFVRREQLVAATSTWLTDKSREVASILVDQGALSESDRDLLAPLVARHLANHDGDLMRSLAALSSIGSVADELRSLGDEKIEATLSMVSTSIKTGSAGPAADGVERSSDAGLRFRILRPHAKGGLGEVSLAQDTEVNREVALKQILPQYANDEQCQARFTLEAEITGGLEHPGIVPVYGLGQYDDGRPFYAMRFIKGDSLQEAAERMHNEGPLHYDSIEFRKLLGRFIDVCEAIEYAHSRGVLHRDLKPGNIMLGKYGETLVVDWGLAKVKGRDDLAIARDEQTLRPASGSGAAPTQMGSAIGTPAFMPPEQSMGNIDQLGPASDIYSLGATLYYLLTAKRPFAAKTLQEALSAVQRGDFPPPRTVNSAIPKPLEAICLRAMALRPGDRYASPMSLAEDVQRWLGDEPVSVYSEPLTARVQRWVRRHQTLAASFAALTFTGLVALAISTLLIGQAQQETAAALSKAQAARRDADKQRADAEEQRGIAEAALLENRRISANLALDRAREVSENGRPDIGLNWYARAMELAPEGDEAFHDLIRANLAEWKSEIVSPSLQFHFRGGGDGGAGRLSRDGTLLYIFRPDAGVVQWNTTTAKPRLLLLPGVETTMETLPRGGTLDASFPVALSPDETICAAAAEKKVYLWDVTDGAVIADPVSFDNDISAIGYQPNGKAVAVGCIDGNCFILDMESKQVVGEALSHGKQIVSVAFRPDGEVLMTGGYDSTVRRWDLKTREEIQPALEHDSLGITAATWSPDGKRIASSDFRQVRLWDVATGESILSVSASSGATHISFSEDGHLLAFGAGDGLVRIWDTRSLRPLYHPLQHVGGVQFVAFDSTKRHLVTLDGLTILRKWRLPDTPLSAKSIGRLDHNRLDVDSAGEVVAFGGMKGVLILCDTETGERIGERDFQEPISSVTFNERGNLLLITGFRGSSRVYATDGLKQVGKTITSKGMAREGDFLDDQLVAIAVMQEGVIRVHNFRTGETEGPEMKHIAPQRVDVVGGKLITEGQGFIRAWSLETREEITSPFAFELRTALRYSPNGKRFAGGTNGAVTIWDAETAERIATFSHPAEPDDVEFSSDSRLLATTGVDDNVRLWHLATATQIGPSRRVFNLTHARFDDKNRLHFTGFDGRQLKHHIWARAPRVEGSAETLRRWVAVQTGLELQPDGNHRVVPWREWNKAAAELGELPSVLEQ